MIEFIALLWFLAVILIVSRLCTLFIFPHEDSSALPKNYIPKLEPEKLAGNLGVQVSDDYSHQDFVFDPVDGQRFYVNSKDDRYEDAAGKIWRLVRK